MTDSPTTPLATRRLRDSQLEGSAGGLRAQHLRRAPPGRRGAGVGRRRGAGIAFLDAADIYGGAGASERLMGAALEGRRDEFLIATKFGWEMSGREGVADGGAGSPGA